MDNCSKFLKIFDARINKIEHENTISKQAYGEM